MLRKSPTRTEAFLAANRRNALKSTGPRTAEGKARSCMNGLKHGRCAKRLPEKLAAAGDHGGAALYQKVRGEIRTTFQAQPDDPGQMRQLDQMTAKVWLLARSAGINGRKPRSPMFSMKLGPRHHSRLLFRIQDRAQGITIVYWVQRKGYWNVTRVMEAVAGRYPADAPTLGEILESKLRHRVFWPGSQPGRWERLLSVVNECRRLVREDVVRPDPGVRPGPAGGNGGSGDGPRIAAAPESAQPSHDEASLGQAGGSGNSTLTTSGARSILAGLLARLFGG